ncbi:MAG: hypothetical protein BWX80_02323 [Candidatus Hydrogenedentes bacterium ADurb.Bin101]|nr:MAG: hypothetical protein BWX80_02323 [Candidatus Hydrogenedentes bacterium ADurb.Bin101]
MLLGLPTVFLGVAEGVLTRASALDLDEVGRGEDGAEQDNVEQVLAVVAGGHHAHGNANAGLGTDVAVEEASVAVEVVVREAGGHLLCVGHAGCHLDCEVRVVLAGIPGVGHLVQLLDDPRRVVLPDAEDDGLADLAAERVAQCVFHEGVAENSIRFVGEELLLEVLAEEGLLDKFAVLVFLHDGIALVRQQFGGDFCSGIHDDRIQEVAFADAVYEAVAEGRRAGLASECLVGVKQLPTFPFAGVAGIDPGWVKLLEVVLRGGGKTEFVADEVLENGAAVAADRPMGLVGDQEVEICGREQTAVLVVELEALYRGNDDLRLAPVVPVFFVDDRAEVVLKETDKGFPCLRFEFKPVHKKQGAFRVDSPHEEFDHGGGGQGLARAGRHFK